MNEPNLIKYLPTKPLIAALPKDKNISELARLLRTQRSVISHLINNPEGRILWITADKFAILLGKHPYEIWGDLWTHEVSPVKRIRNRRKP